MAATAIRLGLKPPATRPGHWFPEEDMAEVTCWRKHVTAQKLAGSAVYVGQTEGCSRSPRTKWASPFVPGRHGTHDECFTKYVLWFRSQKELRESLNEIAGRELACECPPGQPCHADFLASQARMKPDRHNRTPAAIQRRGKLLPQLVMASLVGTATSAYPEQGEIHQRWPQWGLDAAIRSFFPIEWTRGIQIPVLDDLVNCAPFTAFPEFLESLDLDADGPLGPTLRPGHTRGQRRLAEGDQRGSFFAADAVAQIVPLLGLTADGHFSAAARYASQGKSPMNDGLAVETDLQCAAAWTVANMGNLANARTSCYKAVVALAERLQPLSVHLRKRQQGAVVQVASKIHAAFLAVAVILHQWPDVNLPLRYVHHWFLASGHVGGNTGAATGTPHCPSPGARPAC